MADFDHLAEVSGKRRSSANGLVAMGEKSEDKKKKKKKSKSKSGDQPVKRKSSVVETKKRYKHKGPKAAELTEYDDLLVEMLDDGIFDKKEQAEMAKYRKQNGITYDEHLTALERFSYLMTVDARSGAHERQKKVSAKERAALAKKMTAHRAQERSAAAIKKRQTAEEAEKKRAAKEEANAEKAKAKAEAAALKAEEKRKKAMKWIIPRHDDKWQPTRSKLPKSDYKPNYKPGTKEMHECFMVFDSQSEGSITVAEAMDAVRALGRYPETWELQDVVSFVAPEKRTITYKEFCKIAKEFEEENGREELTEAFQKFDPTGAGTVEGSELEEILTKYGKVKPDVAERTVRDCGFMPSDKVKYADFIAEIFGGQKTEGLSAPSKTKGLERRAKRFDANAKARWQGAMATVLLNAGKGGMMSLLRAAKSSVDKEPAAEAPKEEFEGFGEDG